MFELTATNIKNVPKTIGIYKIYAKVDNTIIPIQRFGGVDRSGILYIGTTDKQNLRKRLTQFRLSSDCNMNTTNHSGALKYKKRPIICQVLGLNHKLYFSYTESETPKQLENQLLQGYAEKFGEYPPLNT